MTHLELRLSISGSFLVMLTLVFASRSHAATYEVSDLGEPPAFSYSGGIVGSQINGSGEVAANLLDDNGTVQPLLLTDGNRTTLSALHLNVSANVNAINASGVVVGTSCIGVFPRQPVCGQGVEWTDRVPREIARGANFTPNAINAAGDIAGVVDLANESQVAGVVRDGKLNMLPTATFKPNFSEALAINDSGVIVGIASRPPIGGPTIVHAIIWNGSTVQDLRTDAAATGINDLGRVVGYARAPDGVNFHAASWTNGKLTDLGAPNNHFSGADAINAAGVIVGSGVGSSSDYVHALVWTSGVMSDLNDLIDPKWASHILLEKAVSINDSGQILVNGYDTVTGLAHAYVLSPSGAEIVAQPTFSVIPRTYASTQTVTLGDTTPGAIIHYTLDGALPTSSSPTYTSALTISRTTTIRATAYLSGYQPSPAASGAFHIISGAGSVAVDLSVPNVEAIGDQGPFIDDGLDELGNAYASDLLGTSLVWSGVQFNFNQGRILNGVANTVLALPTGKFASINLLATGALGNRSQEPFTVTYTDGSTSRIFQGISDWATPQAYPGESTALTMNYRVTKTGIVAYGPYHLYGYSLPLDQSKTVKSLTLPNNKYVVVLAATLSGEVSAAELPAGKWLKPEPIPVQWH